MSTVDTMGPPRLPGAEAASRPKVLVVEDEIGPRESLKMILRPPYEVLMAGDGEAGLAEFEASHPDVVISDIRMPHMDGMQFMHEVRSRAPATPFILITGCGTLATAQQAIRAGAFDYISKPFRVEEIRAVVARALEEKRRQMEKTQTMSSLRVLNAQLAEQIRDLERKASLGELSAEMVHDLNNPLCILQGYMVLLEDELDRGTCDRRKRHEFMEVVHEQIDRCARLTQGFLGFARDPAGDWVLTDVNGLIEDTLFLLRLRMRAADIEPSTDLDPGLPDMIVQPSSLQQVFYNLVTNAIQAMEDTGGRLFLSSRYVAPNGSAARAEIVVEDTGAGIAAELHEKVFDSFFTTKPKPKGTGLGLGICRRVVTAHGGEIALDSEPGRGASFRIQLPIPREGRQPDDGPADGDE